MIDHFGSLSRFNLLIQYVVSKFITNCIYSRREQLFSDFQHHQINHSKVMNFYHTMRTQK